MTMRIKHPLVYYLESNKRMLSYRNVRRRAEERVCAREAREKRQEDMRVQSRARKLREQRIAAGVIVERQSTLTEFTKKRRAIVDETDGDEEESGSVNIDDTSGSSSTSVHAVHRVHPDVLHSTRQLQVPASAAAALAAAATVAAATATILSAPAVAVAPSALPAPDVLLPAAGAVLAAVTSSTPDAGWYQRLQRATAAAAAKKATPTRRRQQKKPKQKARQRNQVAALIGNKRQRSGSGEAENGMEIEGEDDEGASGSGSGDRQSGVDLDRQDEDRQGGDSEGNSRATSRQRLGGGGKAGVLT